MLLLHINKKKKKKFFQIYYLKNLINKIKRSLYFLNKIKQNNNLKILRFFLNKKDKLKTYSFKSNSLIKYILGVSIYNTKIVIYLSDIKGKIKFYYTAGALGIKKRQKKKKVTVLVKLIKILMFKNTFLTKKVPIALHFKNLNKKLSVFVLFFLIRYYNIKLVKIINNQPHNGCRPRKIKRKKRRKLNFNKH